MRRARSFERAGGISKRASGGCYIIYKNYNAVFYFVRMGRVYRKRVLHVFYSVFFSAGLRLRSGVFYALYYIRGQEGNRKIARDVNSKQLRLIKPAQSLFSWMQWNRKNGRVCGDTNTMRLCAFFYRCYNKISKHLCECLVAVVLKLNKRVSHMFVVV